MTKNFFLMEAFLTDENFVGSQLKPQKSLNKKLQKNTQRTEEELKQVRKLFKTSVILN